MFEENEHLRERSLLLGQLAEAKSREKRVIQENKGLRMLLLLALFLVPVSHCWFGRSEGSQLSEKNQAVIMQFRTAQLAASFQAIKALATPDSTFTYVVQEGDFPEAIARKFYGDTRFAYFIMLDNGIENDRKLPVGDTIILRQTTEVIRKDSLLNRGI